MKVNKIEGKVNGKTIEYVSGLFYRHDNNLRNPVNLVVHGRGGFSNIRSNPFLSNHFLLPDCLLPRYFLTNS